MAIDISNYYEPLVLSAIQDHLRAHESEVRVTDDLVQDAACIALNQLPARYIRHHVDAYFYLSAEERAAIDQAVTEAVRHAFDHLGREQESPPGAPGNGDTDADHVG